MTVIRKGSQRPNLLDIDAGKAVVRSKQPQTPDIARIVDQAFERTSKLVAAGALVLIPTAAPAAQPSTPTEQAAKIQSWQPPADDGKTYTGLLTHRATAPAAAQSIPPSTLEALKLIRNGEVDVTVPMEAGALPGGVTVRPGTQMTFHLKVQEGEIDFKTADIRFSPALEGPMGVDIDGADFTRKGKLRVDVNWLPDPRIGRKMPSNLSEFVEAVSNTDAMPVKVVGIRVSDIPMKASGETQKNETQAQSTKPAHSNSAPAKPAAATSSPKPASQQPTNPLRLGDAQISVKNFEMAAGTVRLGGSNVVELGPGNRFQMSGTLSDLKMTGNVDIKNVTLQSDGAHISGSGNGSLEVNWKAPMGQPGEVTTRLSNLNLEAQNTRVFLTGGSFIHLNEGVMKGASFTVRQPLKPSGQSWAPGGDPEVIEASAQNFSGFIGAGRLEVNDPKQGQRVISLNGAQLSNGSLSMRHDSVEVKGLLSKLDATLEEGGARFDGHSLNLGDVRLTGHGEIDVDSKVGARFSNANVTVSAPIKSGTYSQDGVQASVGPGQVTLVANEASYSANGGLNIQGSARHVNLNVTDLNIQKESAQISGAQGSIQGSVGDIRLSASKTGGNIQLNHSDLDVNFTVHDTRINLPDGQYIDLNTSRLQTEIQKASVNLDGKGQVGLAGTHLEVPVDSCHIITDKRGNKLNLQGAKLVVDFDQMNVQTLRAGAPMATGNMRLVAKLPYLDAKNLFDAQGATIRRIDGETFEVTLSLGQFEAFQNGDFKALNVAAGVQAKADVFEANFRKK